VVLAIAHRSSRPARDLSFGTSPAWMEEGLLPLVAVWTGRLCETCTTRMYAEGGAPRPERAPRGTLLSTASTTKHFLGRRTAIVALAATVVRELGVLGVGGRRSAPAR
jgi:hypothetical protein